MSPNLTHAIRTFQSGELTHSELFAEVDRVLAAEQANSARLLNILGEEHTRIPLPHDVYVELQNRIERQKSAQRPANIEETRLQTNPGNHADPASTLPPRMFDRTPAEPERIKGVGDTLNGRFVLEECIGFGGMGTVYRALDLRKLEASDRKPYIAIKVLNVQFRGHPKSLIALQREAKKAQTLAHPNIVTVYDFDRDGSMVYLTMEYLAGKPLNQMLRAPGFTGMSLPDTLRIIGGVTKALAYAHERGFVHCDLKPANIFVSDKGEVKVIDFGIARVFHKTEEDSEATVFDAGSLGGMTPAYASPEMIEHLEPDPRDDVYALACITYELLTGRHPFDRLAATQARSAGMQPQRPKNIGQRQWRALRNALSFERASRTPAVAQFYRELSGERPANTTMVLAASGLTLVALVVTGIGVYRITGKDSGTSATGPAVQQATPQATPQVAPPPATPQLSLASVMPVLSQIPCSALTASVQKSTVWAQGYLPKSFGEKRLKETLGKVPGVDNVSLDIRQVDEHECAVLGVLAPYWVRNHQNGRAAAIDTKAARGALTEGDPLIVDIKTPGFPSYVYVDYYSLDGSVAHMVPSTRARANQAPARYSATIGSLGNWVVSKPFGIELITLVVTPVPLFDNLRPEVESRAEYLRSVEKQLAQIAAKHGAERVGVDFVQITTKARAP